MLLSGSVGKVLETNNPPQMLPIAGFMDVGEFFEGLAA